MDAPTYKETHSSEVEAYLAADSTDNYPLNFWNNSTKYPGLSRKVKKFLAVPATSAHIERVISHAGNIL